MNKNYIKLHFLVLVIGIFSLMIYNQLIFLPKILLFFNKTNIIICFILIFYLLLYLALIIEHKKLVLVKLEFVDIFFKNYKQVYFSVIFLVLFLSYFFFYLKVISFFIKKKDTLNLGYYFFRASDNSSLSGVHMFNFFFAIFVVWLFCVCIFLLRFFFFKKAKFNFLRLHYYYYCRFSSYVKFLEYLKDIEIKIIGFLGNGYLYFYLVFAMKHGLRIFLILYFLKNILFDGGKVYLGFLPYYSLYYFIYNIYEFVVISFNSDFEIAIISRYYPKIDHKIELNKFKINKYLNYLVLGISYYKFKDCIYLEYPEYIEKNWIIINTYKYSFNAKPNDFFTKIKKHRPCYVNVKIS